MGKKMMPKKNSSKQEVLFFCPLLQTFDPVADPIHCFGAVVRKNTMVVRLCGRGSWSPHSSQASEVFWGTGYTRIALPFPTRLYLA